MDLEAVRLAIGAFLTSSGFGGLAAGASALVAARRISTDRLEAERNRQAEAEQSAVADARARWWQALVWLDDNAPHLDPDNFTATAEALNAVVHTAEQRAILDAVLAKYGSTLTTEETEGGDPDVG